jgi:hypothetical protein
VDEAATEAAALGMHVGESWTGEAALSTRDAAALVSGSARRDQDHQNAWHQWTVALERWQNEREAVRRRVFEEAWKAGVQAGYGNSQSTDKAHEAAREAVAKYEQATPEPVFSEPAESKIQSLIKRVRAGTR